MLLQRVVCATGTIPKVLILLQVVSRVQTSAVDNLFPLIKILFVRIDHMSPYSNSGTWRRILRQRLTYRGWRLRIVLFKISFMK